jgi:PII-like signaling protein
MAVDQGSSKRKLKLTVRVRSRDEHEGRPITDLLLSLYKANGISGATVLQGVRGYGKSGPSRVDVLGLSVNLPLIIETIDDEEKLRPLLAEVRNIVSPHGLATLETVEVL